MVKNYAGFEEFSKQIQMLNQQVAENEESPSKDTEMNL